jgi:histidyl-tRNA synthetase
MVDTYKGVRDFYPEDERVQKYIFDAMRRAVESYGYEEMNASILEPTELYRAKSSEEIVNEQTYTFTDRGDRSVTLRPEMTPTVARMVAARKRELPYPLRWYSIQNFFRYERPQRGRGREFWQLNADLFGVSGIEADIEVISAANAVMRELGAKPDMYEIRIASRKLLTDVYGSGLKLGVEPIQLFRHIDKKEKMPADVFLKGWEELSTEEFKEITDTETTEIAALIADLNARGIPAVFSPYTVRGFDYYTDLVFEVFDTSAENNRSLFGGGRYDTLVEKYGSEPVPAVGFAMGDMTAKDFLEIHNLMPNVPPTAQLYLAPIGNTKNASMVADTIRAEGINVALGMKHDKVGDHIKAAVKLAIPYFAAYGEIEEKSGELTVKKLATGDEFKVALDKLNEFFVGTSET